MARFSPVKSSIVQRSESIDIPAAGELQYKYRGFKSDPQESPPFLSPEQSMFSGSFVTC
ncbi:hypothetical protein N9D23_12185 [Rubripirellula sp.]|nr:hypothetical protein [Planctomycetaceae bacterium]MDA9858871.1 hypothetical protein [Rubripirellula sp.]